MPDCNVVLTAGVVADTHIPDRVRNFHPELINGLKNNRVDMILHAGDICSSRIINELSVIAPVVAVSGNRDWLFRNRLPSIQKIRLADVDVALLHGHGNLRHYLFDKLKYLIEGYRYDRYRNYLSELNLNARVVVFGHTHRAVNDDRNGVLYFNPGSSGCYLRKIPPSYGVLKFYQGQKVEGVIIPMEKGRVQGRKWLLR